MSGFRTILGASLNHIASAVIQVKEIAGGSRIDMYLFFKFSGILKSGISAKKMRETCIKQCTG
jgi:hypothetical protein